MVFCVGRQFCTTFGHLSYRPIGLTPRRVTIATKVLDISAHRIALPSQNAWALGTFVGLSAELCPTKIHRLGQVNGELVFRFFHSTCTSPMLTVRRRNTTF